MPLALIASAGTTANEYLARHITELGLSPVRSLWPAAAKQGGV